MTVIAQRIYDAWEKEWLKQKDFYEHRALAAALRVLVSECETWEDGTYMVKSNDILDVANELEGK